MQWFIDIIKELIHGQLGYFKRGDPPVFDFSIGDFTEDNAWHDLDLSAIVPEYAKAVNIAIVMRAPAVHIRVDFRENGMVNVKAICTLYTQNANIRIGTEIPCNLDDDRVIEYRIGNPLLNILNFTVCGWWLR